MAYRLEKLVPRKEKYAKHYKLSKETFNVMMDQHMYPYSHTCDELFTQWVSCDGEHVNIETPKLHTSSSLALLVRWSRFLYFVGLTIFSHCKFNKQGYQALKICFYGLTEIIYWSWETIFWKLNLESLKWQGVFLWISMQLFLSCELPYEQLNMLNTSNNGF